MKKLTLLLLIAVFAIAGIALASTVSTQDGKNFLVTNDGGTTVSMTNAQINQKINQFNSAMSRDSQSYLSDQESFIIWNGVGQMEQNAEATWQANQVNGS